MFFMESMQCVTPYIIKPLRNFLILIKLLSLYKFSKLAKFGLLFRRWFDFWLGSLLCFNFSLDFRLLIWFSLWSCKRETISQKKNFLIQKHECETASSIPSAGATVTLCWSDGSGYLCDNSASNIWTRWRWNGEPTLSDEASFFKRAACFSLSRFFLSLKSHEYPLDGWYREKVLASSNADWRWWTVDN